MNMLILEQGESGRLLPRADRRWSHLKKVLRKKAGDTVQAGMALERAFGPAPGFAGRAFIRRLDEEGLVLDYQAGQGPSGDPPELFPLSLVLGFPRPIQAARILRELASLGLSEIHLCLTELGEKSYAESDFFRAGDFRAQLIEGAEQAGNPRLPAVHRHWSLDRCLRALEGKPACRVFLHPSEAARPMGSLPLAFPLILGVGSERGWTEAETLALRDAGFAEAGLGARILKTESAAFAASVIALSRLGSM